MADNVNLLPLTADQIAKKALSLGAVSSGADFALLEKSIADAIKDYAKRKCLEQSHLLLKALQTNSESIINRTPNPDFI
jgi:hypothetical protein